MMRAMRAVTAGLILAAAMPVQGVDVPPEQRVRDAVARTLGPIEEGGVWWIEKHGCASCHRTGVMTWTLVEAKRRRFDVDPVKLDGWIEWSITRDKALNLDGVTRMVLGRDRSSTAHAAAYDEAIDALVKAQEEDGTWAPAGQLSYQKRPELETRHVTTMWVALALGDDETASAAATAARQRGLAAVEDATRGVSSEWYAMRLLLAVQDGDETAARERAEALLAHQHDDGGWGWLVEERSDALATGLAVYALALAGHERTDPVMARALAFLLRTQRADGTWSVKGTLERAREHEEETAVYWGTAWAALGMLRTLPE
jgi:squalene-hopene/tetraprenyl-beta-curcumene cyclase